jgi:hypothetical protein
MLKRKSTNDDKKVSKKSKSKKQEEKEEEEMSVSSTSSQSLASLASSSSEEDISSEKLEKGKQNKQHNVTTTARLMKTTIENIRKQHGNLMKTIEEYEVPLEIMKPVMAIGKILKLSDVTSTEKTTKKK